MAELRPAIDHIFPQYFKKGFVYFKDMIDTPTTFLFKNVGLGKLHLETDINIHGIGYLGKKNISPQDLSLEIAIASSGFFKPFRPEGELVAALRISITDAEAVNFELREDVRVDGGQFVICDLDFVKHNQELEDKNGLDTEALYAALEEKKLEGIEYSFERKDGHNKIVVDGNTSFEIDAGYGDGTYPLWFGYDAAGNLCNIYVDFLLFERFDLIEKIGQMGK